MSTEDQIKLKLLDYDKLISTIVDLERNNYDIFNLDLETAKILKCKWQILYDQLIDIHFAVAKCIYINNYDEKKDIVFKDDLSLTLKQVLVFSEKRANVIQYKYLYPLNIRLNEFAEQDAIKRENESEKRGNRRDIWFLLLGVIIGFVPELITPWIKAYFPCIEPQTKIEQKILIPTDNSQMIKDDLIKLDSSLIKNLDSIKTIRK